MATNKRISDTGVLPEFKAKPSAAQAAGHEGIMDTTE